MQVTPEMVEHYYRTRLDSYRIHHVKGTEWRSRCPVHGSDNSNTLKVDCAEGWFVCFACGVKGSNIVVFEIEMQKVENQGKVSEYGIVHEAISTILGTPLTERKFQFPADKPTGKGEGWDRRFAQARYVYTDEVGEELFSVWRFVNSAGKKVTPPDFPCPCKGNPDAECPNGCVNGRVWGAKGVRRVPYRLVDVLQSLLVFCVEGEKNVDDLSRHLAGYIKKANGFRFGSIVLDRVAVTTNPGGAIAWKKEYGYGKFFTGKIVVKLGDNDGPGKRHDEDACNDIAPYAHKLFTLELPVEEGEDISDFLEKNRFDDFLKLLPKVVPWKQAEQKKSLVKDELEERTLLVKPSHLVGDNADPSGDWYVKGLIERGTRGLVTAAPKTGKSLLFLDMALCLGCRQGFLNFPPYWRPVKVAIISREDGPVMVKRRINQLAAGRKLSQQEVDQNILINTEKQSSTFRIDKQADLDEMAAWLKMMNVEFTVIDVLNRIHGQEENSNTDMTKVMQRFDELAQKSGSQICVIHHTNKAGGTKGATSIEGWADFIFRLEQAADDPEVKTLHVKTKSSGNVQPRTMRYWQSEDETVSQIQLLRKD